VAEADAEAINAVLLDRFLDTPRRKPRRIVLDLDTRAHLTHGQQDLALYNDSCGCSGCGGWREERRWDGGKWRDCSLR